VIGDPAVESFAGYEVEDAQVVRTVEFEEQSVMKADPLAPDVREPAQGVGTSEGGRATGGEFADECEGPRSDVAGNALEDGSEAGRKAWYAKWLDGGRLGVGIDGVVVAD